LRPTLHPNLKRVTLGFRFASGPIRGREDYEILAESLLNDVPTLPEITL
jgi:hypothetical protein